MAQRNSPSDRVPDQSLAGILRTLAYQARYSNRRRSDVPTITNRAATAVSAEVAAAASDVAALAAPATLSATAAPAEAQLMSAAATDVATGPIPEPATATVLITDENGRATWSYPDRGTVPVIVATVCGDRPAVATVIPWGESAATVYAWTLSGDSLPGATLCVAAHWP